MTDAVEEESVSEETGKVEEFKDDSDFLAKVRDTDATPEDVERFHSIIERLTRKADLCDRLVNAARAFSIDPKDDDGIEDNSCEHHIFKIISEYDREEKK